MFGGTARLDRLRLPHRPARLAPQVAEDPHAETPADRAPTDERGAHFAPPAAFAAFRFARYSAAFLRRYSLRSA